MIINFYKHPSYTKTKYTLDTFLTSVNTYIPQYSTAVVGVDPSKTGWAMTVLQVHDKKPLYSIEIDGHNETLDDVVDAIKKIINKCLAPQSEKIALAGFEEVISKRNQGNHLTNVMLNEVRVYTKEYLGEIFGKSSVDNINNNRWKGAVLSKELRKREVKKGSLLYINQKFGYSIQSDNVTDSMCIAIYLADRISTGSVKADVMYDVDSTKARYIIRDNPSGFDASAVEFVYNVNYNLYSNIESIASTYPGTKLIGKIPISCLTFDEIAEANVVLSNNADDSVKDFVYAIINF